MAKKKVGGPNKSQAIRDLWKANPKMKAKEIVSTLAGKGIAVNVGLVLHGQGPHQGKKRPESSQTKAHRSGGNGGGIERHGPCGWRGSESERSRGGDRRPQKAESPGRGVEFMMAERTKIASAPLLAGPAAKL